MENKTIAEALLDYFEQFPLLKGGCLNLDFLPPDAKSYAVEINPSESVVEAYIDGSAVRQLEFVFCSTEYYGEFTRQHIDNSGFYERLAEWVKENNKSGVLPVISNGKEAEQLLVLTPGYLFQNDLQTARYQIQFKLQYYEEA